MHPYTWRVVAPVILGVVVVGCGASNTTKRAPTPPPSAACGRGTRWNGTQCVAIPPQACPPGQTWDGEACAPCPDGTHWEAQGCISNATLPKASSLVRPSGDLATLAAAAVVGCTTEPPAPTGGELDCAWVNSSSNCYRAFVAAVDECLGTSTTATGSLVEGGCVYPDGRIVESSAPLDQLPAEGSTDLASRDFTVRVSGNLCLHFRQEGRSATATTGAQTLAWTSDGEAISLTCPDGRVLRGDDVSLIGCLDPRSGGLPGYAWSNAPGSAYFSLLGMRGPAYACEAPLPGDAGPETDGEAGTDAGTDASED